jgi:hypothetical protein
MDRFDIDSYIRQFPERIETRPKPTPNRETAGESLDSETLSNPIVNRIISDHIDNQY